MANSNGCFSAYSNEVTITASAAFTPTITASATSFCTGDSVTLTATVSGSSHQWNINDEQIPGAITSTISIKSGGNFSVSETSNDGCIARSQTIIVQQKPTPIKPVITQIGNDLRSSAQNGNQWYKGGVIIPNATSQTFTPPASGNYSVQVTQNGCASTLSDLYSYVITSIISIDNTHYIKLSPNPVHNEMFLDFNLMGIYQLNIDLFDVNGRIIKRWQNQKKGSRLSLSDCSSAIYFARISSTNGQMNSTLKLVKQ
jgi:hypothetical protein